MFRATDMWWFNKPKRTEIWDEEITWPMGDIEAAHKIRDICRSALDSAETVGRDGAQANNQLLQEFDRYERAAKVAMQIAMKISDDLLRDSAVRQIVALCLTANDLRTARILFRAIQAASMKEDVLKEYPELRQ